MRHCSVCNEHKPLSDFTRSNRHAGGYFPLCKICKNNIKREQERKMRESDKEQSQQQKTDVVRANLHVPKDNYEPHVHNPTGYQREDGNKQYKSKGLLC